MGNISPSPLTEQTIEEILSEQLTSYYNSALREKRKGFAVATGIALLGFATTTPTPPPGRTITNDEYIEIVLKYKNAIIDSLNTMEAVKAVIQSKPLPFKITIFYKDTLEGRYRDIIEELKVKLMDFIVAYRESHPNRETEAWYVLTSDESYLNDFVNVVLYFLVFFGALTAVYLIKMQIRKYGYLQDS